jgi:prefoldin subunit 5
LYADVELNESLDDKKAGRTHITMTALTIHERGQWNRRGITWLEEYVRANLDSIIGAPYVVRFIDDEKTIPSDHGTLTYDENGNCQFLDSDVVGSIQKAWIQEVEVDGVISKKLVTSGYLYNQRCPNFVKWLKNEMNTTKIKGSVEANGKGDNKSIIYEDGSNGKDENDEWKIGRIPVVFDFAALAILLPNVVTEADSGSEIIELNNIKQSADITSDDIETTNINKEVKNMAEISNDAIVELNNKIVELNNKINELTAQIEAKDTEINSLKEKETELNSLLLEANKTIEAGKTQIAELNSEIEPLRQLKEEVDKAKAIAEVNSYFETIKKENGFTEAELNALKTEYVDKCDLDGLKAKEQELCIAKFKEMRRLSSVNVELNSNNDMGESLFFSTKIETIETNNVDDGSDLFG